MEKKLDIVTIGESLVELSSNTSLVISENFTKFFGGDTLCTAVSALRSGSTVGYITKIGNDPFGEYLLDALQLEGLDTSQIKLDNGQNGVYFIGRTKEKNTLQYYRKKTAASKLSLEDINFDYINSAKLFYATGFVQSLSLNCSEAIREIYSFTKENKIITAYDPNYSPNVWEAHEAREAFEAVSDNIDILFLRDDTDANVIFETDSIDEIIKKVSDMAISTVVIKEYKKGIHIVHAGNREFIEYIPMEIIDATGCDAAFNGAFLSAILDGATPYVAGKYANTLSMLQIQKVGAVKSIPNKKAVQKLYEEIYG